MSYPQISDRGYYGTTPPDVRYIECVNPDCGFTKHEPYPGYFRNQCELEECPDCGGELMDGE